MSKVQFGVVCALLIGIFAATVMPIIEPALIGHGFEYKIVSFKDDEVEKQINVAGDNGWDLVFARRAMGSGTDREAAYEMIFKRVK